MPGIRTAFCYFATQFWQGLPLRNYGAENKDKAPRPDSQVVTFLIIDAVPPGY